jgi:hypothetical protein
MLKLKLHSIAELVLYAVRNEIVHVQLPAGLYFHNPGKERRRPPASSIDAAHPQPGNSRADVAPQGFN